MLILQSREQVLCQRYRRRHATADWEALPSKSVPGLKEHGVGDETVAGLMEPPCRRTIATQCLAAHVPGKQNCYREAHVNHRHEVREGGGLRVITVTL